MLDYDDENSPPASSKTFSSIKFRRSGVPTKGKSGLKVAISAPYALDRGGVPPSLGDPPLQTLNGTGALQPNSADPVLDGPPSSPQTLAQGFRRNSEIPLKQHRSRLAWPSNHPEITPNGGSPHPSTRGTRKKLRKADVSKLPALDSPRFSSISGIGRKRPPCSTRTNTGFRLSETAPTTVPEGCLGEAPAPQQPSFEKQAPGSDLLKTPSDEFDPRAVMGPLPALNFDLASAASFGSVKQRIRKIDKSLRTSRMMLLSAPAEKAKPELMYTDDSDAFSSPPSTPSTPIWETTPASSMQKIDPKLSSELELADVHAQIQAMIDSANRPFSVESADFLDRDREPSGTQRNDIPPSLRPGNIVHTSFPPRVIVHRRSASSPPLGSGIHHAYPPDFRDRPLFQPTTPVTPHGPASPASRPPEMGPTSPPSTSPADSMTPSTPHKKPSSEQSDSPSVYSQLSPSSRIYNVTPSSSYTSSPDHPYAKSKHERLLAAISEGISSPTKPGPTAPSILGSNPSRDDNTNLFIPPLVAQDPTVPVIVITNPNDDNLVYNESNSSIVDMYAGSADGSETVLRKRTRTANSVSDITLQVPRAR